MSEAKAYELDGCRIDLFEFLAINQFDHNEIAAILALKIGERIVYGGGAAATVVLRCVALSEGPKP